MARLETFPRGGQGAFWLSLSNRSPEQLPALERLLGWAGLSDTTLCRHLRYWGIQSPADFGTVGFLNSDWLTWLSQEAQTPQQPKQLE